MTLSRHPALQTATGWLLALALVFTCGVPVPARGNFQKPASVFPNRQQISQTDALGRVTRYEYDNLGRRTKRTLPLGMSEITTYDAVGNVSTRTDFKGKVTTYQYDNLNRLIRKIPDSSLGEPDVVFTYTAQGQRAGMSDASGVTLYEYDNRLRLTLKSTPQGNLNYEYDDAGNLERMHSSNVDGVDVSYGYDDLDRLSTVTDTELGQTAYGYDAVGNLLGYAYPNGVSTAHAYNSMNRLTGMASYANGNAQPLAAYAYSLNAKGMRIGATESGSGVFGTGNARMVSYGYDNAYRLVQETITATGSAGPTGVVGYTHDAVGNRLTRSSTVAGLPAGTYAFDANDRLLSDVYDANGNTIASESKSDSYDFEDRLVSRTEPGKGITVVYDGDGNRVRETVTVGATTTEVSYLVDELNHTGHAQVVEELVNGVVVKSYTYGHDLLAQDQRENAQSAWVVSWYGYDGHGNVRYLTDATGSVTDAYDYDAFGVALRTAGSTANRYRYSGEQYDEALGLYYLRARYFNALGGRFWSMDSFEGSMGDPASLHKYTYANNDPVNMVDPSGHYSLTEGSFVQNVGGTARLMCRELLGQWTKCKVKSVAAGAGTGALVSATVGGALTSVIGYVQGDTASEIGNEIMSGLWDSIKEGAMMGAAANIGTATFAVAMAVQFARTAKDTLEALNDPSATMAYKGMMLANLVMEASPFLGKTVRGKLKEFLTHTFCFSGDTLVATKDGEQAIESIQAGQEVWAADPISGERKLSRVVAKTMSIATALLVLNIGGEEVQATETHPFQVVGQGMTAAGNLKVGDQIERRSGESAAVESIALRVGSFPVYNLEVADAHTYFVGRQELLVHNKCWNVARSDYWKKRAEDAFRSGSKKYSQTNLMRMAEGKAPLMRVEVRNRKNPSLIEVKEIPIELHHQHLTQRSGAAEANDAWNLTEVNPWSHEAMDEFRHAGWDLLKIIDGPNSF